MGFGERLKSVREERRMEPKDIAIDAGITVQQYYRLEKQAQLPNGETLRGLAKALQTTISFLAGEEENSEPKVFRGQVDPAIAQTMTREEVEDAIRRTEEQIRLLRKLEILKTVLHSTPEGTGSGST